MLLVDLNGKWSMRRADSNDYITAKVPGSVYNDLLTAGLMEDPFYRDNEYEAMKLSEYDYEYSRSFNITAETVKNEQIHLLCEGLDTIAQLFINGKMLSETDNMHRRYEFDIKGYIFEGENEIRILFKSPLKYVAEKQAEFELYNANDVVKGFTHLRKAHCMFGWDWGPTLPDMGIWRNISIIGFNTGRIGDIYVTQHHEQERVMLDVRLNIDIFETTSLIGKVHLRCPNGNIIESMTALNTKDNHIELTVNSPQLWWPNNFGDQPLYELQVELLSGTKLLDIKSLKIGLRTLTVKTEPDEWGESFAFEINGKTIFSMGANYIPEDNILSRCNKERTEKLIKSCIDANFNTIRVWGGGYYPSDYFYELCDEYGLIVWQDLMYACGIYRLTPEFKENIKQETIDNMKRLRHHASLGLWCGNNEQEVAWVEWGWSQRFSEALKVDYIKQFEVLLPEIAHEVDPNTFYWLASPSSTGSFFKPNDQNHGDMHYWEVWHGQKPFTAYRDIFPRYMSEFGLQSFPCLKTAEAFTLPEDRNAFSYVMESHQKCGTGNEKILFYISENYKYPKSFDALLYASQLIQAEGLRYGVEHWRRNRGRCMGSIYWQLNDCWPVASWASIDYYGRYKALHYAAKRFHAPILVSACEEGTSVSLHVTNETLNPINGLLKWSLRTSDSKIIKSSEKQVSLDSLSSIEAEALEFSDILNTKELQRDSYLEFYYEQENEVLSSGTVLFVKSKHFNYKAPKLKATFSETSTELIINIEAKAFAKFIELNLKDYDAIFSDNFFDLSAGTTKKICIKKETLKPNLTIEELETQLTLRSLYDTYEAF